MVCLSLATPSLANDKPTCDEVLTLCDQLVTELDQANLALKEQVKLYKEQRDEAVEKLAERSSGTDWYWYVIGGVAIGALGAAAVK